MYIALRISYDGIRTREDINFTRPLRSSARDGSLPQGKIKIGIRRDYRSSVLSCVSQPRDKGTRVVVELYYLARFTFRGVVACVVEK